MKPRRIYVPIELVISRLQKAQWDRYGPNYSEFRSISNTYVPNGAAGGAGDRTYISKISRPTTTKIKPIISQSSNHMAATRLVVAITSEIQANRVFRGMRGQMKHGKSSDSFWITRLFEGAEGKKEKVL
jgi:hypothetical protein